MEDQRFDALVRAVATGASRRHVLGALVGGLAALILAMGLWPEPLLVVGEGAAAILAGAPEAGTR